MYLCNNSVGVAEIEGHLHTVIALLDLEIAGCLALVSGQKHVEFRSVLDYIWCFNGADQVVLVCAVPSEHVPSTVYTSQLLN